ncbi:hypothetical protein KRR40_12950 [Niabella defluvii]|nr:hypothetical protein KRR40_12950 [Niabella sp. I65]
MQNLFLWKAVLPYCRASYFCKNYIMRSQIIAIAVSLVIFSCKNNYKYVDSKGKTETIVADNDKDAYSKAFEKFQISKKISEKTSKALGMSSDAPIYFDLYDSKGSKVIASINEDSVESIIEKQTEGVTKSIKEARVKSVYSDTSKLHDCPIKVIKARFYQEEYSSFKDVSLTFKNISKKKK